MNQITTKILDLLNKYHISYELIEHKAAPTCDDAAILRGKALSIGGKSILFKDKKGLKLFTLPANKMVDNKKVRKILKSQKLRFATTEELFKFAGVVTGALPPLSKNIYPFDHYIDNSILNNKSIAFNAGILTLTVIIKIEDYLKLVDATFCDFSY